MATIEETPTPVTKPENVRELVPVDLSTIKPMVLKLSETVWNLENERKENNFGCFHHTRHIIFRFIRDNRNARDFYSHPIWEVWKPTLEPVFRAVIEPYGFRKPEFPKAMLARLQAGHRIDPHIDGAGSNLHTHKIHIPIQTNPNALFTTNGWTGHLDEGVAYEVNNVAPHGVENRGQEDRIHLIFEVFDTAA